MSEQLIKAPKVILIAAVAKNNVIGSDNKLPWNIKEEMEHFRRTTLGHVVVMGHKTWKSFGGKVLPGRDHVVISRNPERVTPPKVKSEDFEFTTASSTVGGISKGVSIAHEKGTKVFIIGGLEVYRKALKFRYADELLITELDSSYPGDTYWPGINEDHWEAASSQVLRGKDVDLGNIRKYVKKDLLK